MQVSVFYYVCAVTLAVTAHVDDASHRIQSRTKFEVRRSPLWKLWRIFRLSISRPRDL